MAQFLDHFSGVAQRYASYRPTYPEQLFNYLADLVPQRRTAWDCATGNGQAALQLARHFDLVVATDASRDQINSAPAHDRIRYEVTTAEDPGLENSSVDLVTVAQALHWFDRPRFYDQVRRVLRAGGIFAAWAYGLFRSTAAVDRIIQDWYSGPLDDYWPEERHFIETLYSDIPIPFPKLATPDFAMTARWDLERTLGYLSTWSALKRVREETGQDPFPAFAEELGGAWGEGPKEISWPLALIVCRVD